MTDHNSSTSREVLHNHFASLLEFDTTKVLSRLAASSKAKGECLFAAGDKAGSLYFIVKGCFAVHKPVGIGNRSQAVALLSVGALAGEASLLVDRRRGATMVAVEDSKVLELPHDTLCEIELENPQLYIALLKRTLGVVSQRLQKSSERLALIL